MKWMMQQHQLESQHQMLQLSSGRKYFRIESKRRQKFFSKLKLVTDNLLSIYAAANWEATESQSPIVNRLRPRLRPKK